MPAFCITSVAYRTESSTTEPVSIFFHSRCISLPHLSHTGLSTLPGLNIICLDRLQFLHIKVAIAIYLIRIAFYLLSVYFTNLIMETSELTSIPDVVASGDKYKIISTILASGIKPIIEIFIKIAVIIALIALLWVGLDKLFTLFKVELHIYKITLGSKEGFGRYKNSKVDKEFIQALQKSMIAMSEEISQISHDQYTELSDETRNKIKNYINKVIQFYSSYVADESKNSTGKKEVYLMSSSLAYLKELMTLAAYDSDIINKVIEAIIQMMEQQRLGSPTSITETTKRSIISTVTNTFAEPFGTHNYPFEEKIDHRSISEVIEHEAKKQVTEIIEDLEDFYTNNKDKYKAKMEQVVKNYLATMDGISMEDLK